MPIRILVADDHAVVREGLRAVLGKECDIEIAGEAADGDTAVRLTEQLKPDLVIMDVEMPQLNGIEATKLIVQRTRGRVVALSGFANLGYIQRMFKAGAMGYLLKQCALEELLTAVRAVVRGERFVSASLTPLVVQDYLTRLDPGEDGPLTRITDRERQIIQLIAEGKTTQEIAEMLHVGVSTVHTHRSNVQEKLGLATTADLIRFAVREGIASPHR